MCVQYKYIGIVHNCHCIMKLGHNVNSIKQTIIQIRIKIRIRDKLNQGAGPTLFLGLILRNKFVCPGHRIINVRHGKAWLR